jgi:hypothetical protein
MRLVPRLVTSAVTGPCSRAYPEAPHSSARCRKPSLSGNAAVARQDPPPRENLADLARRLFGPTNGADLDIPPRGTAPECNPPDFSGPEYDPA